MTEPTNREAHAQMTLIVIAIAASGIVLAFTSDFIIGIGVGAAFFAVARQARKVRGRTRDHETETEPTST